MNKYGLTFHHLGLASSDEPAALTFLRALNYRIGDLCYDPLQKVNLRMCDASDQPTIELISRADRDGPLENYLKNSTGLIYHSCYSSRDSELSLARMKADGLRVMTVAPATPAILFHNQPVSFYMIKGVGLLELLHEQ